MAIARRSSAAAAANSLTLPTHQAGDQIILAVYRDNSTTAPTNPSGWTAVALTAGGTNWLGIFKMLASSASEVSGTWTNATHIASGVYYSSTGKVVTVGIAAGGGGTAGSGGSINYQGTGGTVMTEMWVVAAAGHVSADTDINVAPTALTNYVAQVGGSTGEIALHDSNGTLTTFAFRSKTLSAGTSGVYRTLTAELVETNFVIPSGGGGMIGGGNLNGGFQ